MKQTKTYTAKPSQITRQWYLLDASTANLGRVATVAARYLIGKHKPSYTANIDVGDSVIVINSAKLKFSGNKAQQKLYYSHSGHPGALKTISLEQQLAKDPNKVITKAVKGMLPKNKLQAGRLKRLVVVVGSEHPHTAQQPQELKAESIKPKEGK